MSMLDECIASEADTDQIVSNADDAFHRHAKSTGTDLGTLLKQLGAAHDRIIASALKSGAIDKVTADSLSLMVCLTRIGTAEREMRRIAMSELETGEE